MCCIMEVFCKTVCLVIVTEGSSVLFVPHGKSSTSLSNVSYCNQGRKVFMLWIGNICLSREFFYVSRFPIVFFVRKAILRCVSMKMFVMYDVSLPTYVKLGGFWIHHLGWFRCLGFVGLDGKRVVL